MDDIDKCNIDYDIEQAMLEFPDGGKPMMERIWYKGNMAGFAEGLDEGARDD